MIRPRFRRLVCTSVAAASLAGGAVFTQAAGPGELLSRLWKREPAPAVKKESGSRLFRWFRRGGNEAAPGRVRISDGGNRVTSNRPELVQDPFLAAPGPGVIASQKYQESGRAPRSVQSDRVQSGGRLPEAAISSSGYSGNGQRATKALSESSQQKVSRTVAQGQQNQRSASTATSVAERPVPAGDNTRFAPGFDAEFQKLVNSVLSESPTEHGKEQQNAAPRLPGRSDLAASADSAATEHSEGSPQLQIGTFQSSDADVAEAAVDSKESQRDDFAKFAQELKQRPVGDLIEESRREMDSSPLARRASGELSVSSQLARTASQQPHVSQNGVSAASHSGVGQGDQDEVSLARGGHAPQRLPDVGRPSGSGLIVSTTDVPKQRLYTSSEAWLNRSQMRHSSQQEGSARSGRAAGSGSAYMEVVPGLPGGGVIIDSGHSSTSRPRVTSNGAPSRSVPDTTRFRRLAFQGVVEGEHDSAVLALAEKPAPSGLPSAAGRSDTSVAAIPAFGSNPLEARSGSADMSPMLIIPDGRTGDSVEIATERSPFDVAAAPPAEPATIPWPDEAEIAPVQEGGGGSWTIAAICLALLGAGIGLLVRRKSHADTIIPIGSGSEVENS